LSASGGTGRDQIPAFWPCIFTPLEVAYEA